MRSANVLVEGRYSDVIKPWRHYIPIDKDLSNVAEVIRALRDEKLLINIISVAFAEIAQKREYTYEGFADQIDLTVNRHMGSGRQSNRRAVRPPKAIGESSGRDQADASAGPTDDKNGMDFEALEKIAKFYYLANPNAYTVQNPARHGEFSKRLRTVLRRVRSFLHH